MMHKQQHKFNERNASTPRSKRQQHTASVVPIGLSAWVPTNPEDFAAWANVVNHVIKEHGKAFHEYHFGSKNEDGANRAILKQNMDAAYELACTCLKHAYPPGFWENMDALIAGNAPDLEPYIRFIEADLFFFRSGYARATVLTALKRHPITIAHRYRLQEVILSVVDSNWRTEFKFYCRLARYIQSEEFVQELMNRAAYGTYEVRIRANHVLKVCWQRPQLRANVIDL